MLANNIKTSEYFRHDLYALKTYHEVLHEIRDNCDHVEPFAQGTARVPSTAFSCLYKMFLMQLTEKQLQGMLDYRESVYVRAVGLHLKWGSRQLTISM